MKNGFTLSELLIALVILGLIATFTIPKVLQSQQNAQYKSSAKEVASMISGAYQAALSTGKNKIYVYDLTPYMNYVAVDTVSQFNDPETLGYGTPGQCGDAANWYPLCLRLHNGGLLVICDDPGDPEHYVIGPGGTYHQDWGFDPDGKYTTPEDKLLWLTILTSGRIQTYGEYADDTGWDPSWFSWN